MNILDVVFVLIILLFGVIGFKRGVFKQLVMSVGVFLICLIAWYLKTPIATALSLHMPFWNLSNYPGMIPVLNILFYQTVGFCVVFGILMIILQVLINATSLFEKILKATVILAIPSKICGFIVGLIEGYVLVFIAAFFLSQPSMSVDFINQSSIRPWVLNNTVILSNSVGSTYDAMSDIYKLKEKYEATEEKDYESLSRDSVEVLAKYGIANSKYLQTLKDNGRLNIKGVDSVIQKYSK